MGGLAILGIDPGRDGGIAFLDGESVMLEPMPQDADGKLDMAELVRLLAYYVPQSTCVYLELAGMRPGQSTQTTAAQWRGFGRLEGVLSALHARYEIVNPRTWSAQFDHGVTEQDKSKRYAAIKKARAIIAARLYPGIDLKKTIRSTTAHEGMVDALLIAAYGYKVHQNQQHEGRIPS